MSEPIFKSLEPNVMVDDVNETVDFYQKNLGFTLTVGVDEKMQTVDTTVDSHRLVWAMLARGDASLMIQNRDSLVEEVPELKEMGRAGAFTLYFSVQHIDTLYNELKDKVEVYREPHKTLYGADEFVVRDNNGNFLFFAEQHRH